MKTTRIVLISLFILSCTTTKVNYTDYAERAIARQDWEAAYRLLEDQLISDDRSVRDRASQLLQSNPELETAAKQTFSISALRNTYNQHAYRAIEIEEKRLTIYKYFASEDDYKWAYGNYESVFSARIEERENLSEQEKVVANIEDRAPADLRQIPQDTPDESIALEPAPTSKTLVGAGTGWPVKQGYVITNEHIVRGGRTVVLVDSEGNQQLARIVIRDPVNDIAILKPEIVNRLPPSLPLATMQARIGAGVFTIGFPYPDIMGIAPKLTSGIISAVSGLGDDPRFYQISVPVQPGNSGGPLLNAHGEVVGIITSKLSATSLLAAKGDLPQNVNYAVKVGYASLLLRSDDSPILVELPRKLRELEDLAETIKNSILLILVFD